MSSQYKNIVILTGAGISAESGIKTFRDTNGLWEEFKIEDVASPEGFVRNPDLVNKFYNDRRRQLLSPEIQPNAAHEALAKLQQEHNGSVAVITQNIDDLHTRGGFENTIHIHGELFKIRCDDCQEVVECKTDIPEYCDACDSPALRPHIVWFGEFPFYQTETAELVNNCDLFISIGTSGQVYPAAGMAAAALNAGAVTVNINLDCTPQSNFFKYDIVGPATEMVPMIVNNILNGKSFQ